jgi:hypothetical protein
MVGLREAPFAFAVDYGQVTSNPSLIPAREGLPTPEPQDQVQGSYRGIYIMAHEWPLLPAQTRTSATMHADAKQTDFCVYLSAILLTGLLLNAGSGWWWADPTAALIMVPLIANEGVEAMKGKACCD